MSSLSLCCLRLLWYCLTWASGTLKSQLQSYWPSKSKVLIRSIGQGMKITNTAAWSEIADSFSWLLFYMFIPLTQNIPNRRAPKLKPSQINTTTDNILPLQEVAKSPHSHASQSSVLSPIIISWWKNFTARSEYPSQSQQHPSHQHSSPTSTVSLANTHVSQQSIPSYPVH